MISLGPQQVPGSPGESPGGEAPKREQDSTAAKQAPQVKKDCEAGQGELCPKEQGGQQDEDLWKSP